MSRFDQVYDIRLARVDEQDAIMRFIDEYWRRGHILSYHRELFAYEHIIDGALNFVLAVSRVSGEIEGILGFIPASRHPEKLDVWTGLWKVKENTLPLLGVELYKRLPKLTGARAVLGVGDNPHTTGRLLKVLMREYRTWKMDHYYRLAPRDKFRIASISHRPQVSQNPALCSEVRRLTDPEQLAEYFDPATQEGFPYKDFAYLDHRYFRHPIYRYQVFGLLCQGHRALVVVRIEETGDGKCARIVDFLGDPQAFAGTGPFWERYLAENALEYADFYVHGLSDDCLKDAGFTALADEDENIIPDYFHPFERRNVDIYVSGNVPDALFCKADGDQDRPN